MILLESSYTRITTCKCLNKIWSAAFSLRMYMYLNLNTIFYFSFVERIFNDLILNRPGSVSSQKYLPAIWLMYMCDMFCSEQMHCKLATWAESHLTLNDFIWRMWYTSKICQIPISPKYLSAVWLTVDSFCL